MKYVITMTSWTQRIQYVAASIRKTFDVFSSAMQKNPDYFYLWLAEVEFPNKEKDLSAELLQVIDTYSIRLRWTKENEYCFKRWHVYPEHFNDTVISVDDDMTFTPDQIRAGIRYAEQYPNAIIDLAHLYYANVFNHSMHKELIHWFEDKPSFYTNLAGQCIVPPRCFPVEVMGEQLLDLRMKLCNKCDETWLNPFLVRNEIKVFNAFELNPIQEAYEKDAALHTTMDINKPGNMFNYRDAQLFVILSELPELRQAWLKHFPGYMKTEKAVKDMMEWQSEFPQHTFTVNDFYYIPDYFKSY